MILITIVIFSLYTVFAILSNSLFMWCLDFISIVYSILFITQEMSILLKSDKTLLKIVRNFLER